LTYGAAGGFCDTCLNRWSLAQAQTRELGVCPSRAARLPVELVVSQLREHERCATACFQQSAMLPTASVLAWQTQHAALNQILVRCSCSNQSMLVHALQGKAAESPLTALTHALIKKMRERFAVRVMCVWWLGRLCGMLL